MSEKKEVKRRPTALKRDLQNEKKRIINKSFRSRVRTAMRDFDEAVKSGDHSAIQARLSSVYSVMDKGVKRGVYKINTASRTKLRASKRAALLAS